MYSGRVVTGEDVSVPVENGLWYKYVIFVNEESTQRSNSVLSPDAARKKKFWASMLVPTHYRGRADTGMSAVRMQDSRQPMRYHSRAGG